MIVSDMHIHTTYSDGVKTLSEVADMINSTELKTVSITDHDTVEAYLDADIGKIKAKVIHGCEITSMIADLHIEILAYGFRLNEMRSFLEHHRKHKQKTQQEYFEIYASRMIKSGIKLSNTNESLRDGMFAGQLLHKKITEHEENKQLLGENLWGSPSLMFRTLTVKGGILYVDQSEMRHKTPQITSIAAVIRDCGGIPILAHPCAYKLSIPSHSNYEDELCDLVSSAIKKGMSGIELGHPNNSIQNQQVINDLLEYSNFNKKVVITGGSDYHGYADSNRAQAIGIYPTLSEVNYNLGLF